MADSTLDTTLTKPPTLLAFLVLDRDKSSRSQKYRRTQTIQSMCFTFCLILWQEAEEVNFFGDHQTPFRQPELETKYAKELCLCLQLYV